MTVARTEFDSGLRVISERMPGVRSVALGIWVGTGSRDEQPRILGASHFLEHLLFKGTRTRSAQDIAEAFDVVGGDLNAFTAKENTCFYSRVRDKDLPMAVAFLGDMIQDSVLRPSDFDAERQVILEEIHMRDDTPDDLVHDLMNETLWPDHPLGRAVLGTLESIESTSRDQVRRFYKKHYVPGNLVIALAGNVKHEDAVKLVRANFDAGKIRRTKTPGSWLTRQARDVPRASGRSVVHRRPTEQAHLCLGANGLARSDPDRFALGIVNNALGGGMSSRLFQEVREKRGLAYSVYSYHQMYAEVGLFAVYAGTTPSKAQEVLALVHEQLEDVAGNGITQAELDKAKGHMKGSMVLSMEETSGRMSRLGKSAIMGGEVLTVSQALKRVDAVTLDDTLRVAERVLDGPLSLAVVGPFDADAFGATEASFGEAEAAHHGGPA
ncbi:MAG: pitrilysin family protein [Actinomycetota bacterium]